MYIPPFDREGIAQKVAERDKVSPQEVKCQWDIRRDFSIIKGTEFHLYVEKYLQDRRKIETITPISEEIKQFHQFWDEKNKKRYELMGCELILYDKSLKLAGTLDCLLKHKDSDKVYIVDWKTNKEIKMKNKYESFSSPFEHLDVSDINKYSLQIGMYSYLLKKNANLNVDASYLVHFQKDADSFKVIHCRDLSQEIETIVSKRQQSIAN